MTDGRPIDTERPPAGQPRLTDELGLEAPPEGDRAESSLIPGPGVGANSRPRRRAVILAAAAVLVIGVGGFLAFRATQPQPSTTATVPGASSTPAGVHVQASSVAYTQTTLGAQARTLLGAPSAAVAGSQAVALGPVATPAGLTSCLGALGESGTGGVSVDLASYEGTPAAIIVVARDDGSTSAYAVGRQCTAGDPQILQDAVPVP